MGSTGEGEEHTPHHTTRAARGGEGGARLRAKAKRGSRERIGRAGAAARRALHIASLSLLPSHPTITLSPHAHIMPWQKTFTLSSRSKGVHLVTDEVMQHIGAGVKECKVGLLQLLCVRAAP